MRLVSSFVLAGCLMVGTAPLCSAAPAGPVRAEPAPVDLSVDPCTDFFQYACNAWIKQNPIPDDQTRWGRFDALQRANQKALHSLLDAAVAHPTPDSQKVADYYAACLDEAAIEAKGLAPVQPLLAEIDGLTDKRGLAPLIARLHRLGVNALFSAGVRPDAEDSRAYLATVDQGGLGLPDRDYYTKTDAKSVAQRTAYEAHVAAILTLAGSADGAGQAKTVLTLETALAEASLSRVKRRDPSNVNHKRPAGDLGVLAGDFDWQAYFKHRDFPGFEQANIAVPDFVAGLKGVLEKTDLKDLKTYLRWQVLHHVAPVLPKAFEDADFAFFSKVLNGAEKPEPRWLRCVRGTDRALGESLGKLYVATYFPPEAAGRMKELVKNLRAAFETDIATLDWMGPETKVRARAKLDSMVEKIGHPERWRDYGALEVKAGDAFGNYTRAFTFEIDRQIHRLGKPVDRTEWNMTAPTVNAYYNPSNNDINFPAGILQPPFFDAMGDDAGNYGAIGAVIGHEMTHGFDDQGRKYDKDGNLKDFWTKEDADAFKERASCLVKEYSGFEVGGGVFLNGELTLGENTADNGGVRLAYAALKRRLAEKHGETVLGFTPEQRFFLGYAGVWCSSIRQEAARTRALTDPHSDGRSRVNGVVANMPEFAEAFHCPAKPVAATPACKVW